MVGATAASAQSSPTVTAISPALGSTAGGTAVTITGTDFTSATKVSFGSTDVLAANFTSISGTQIVVNSPAGAAGTVNVTVTTPAGTSANNGTADDFEYGTAPTRLFDFIVANRAYDNVEPPVSTSGFFGGVPTGYYLGLSGTDTSVSIAGGVMSINSSGVLSFARPAGFRGEATVSVRAYNALGESQPLPVTFRLLDPTLVTSVEGSGARQGVALSGYSVKTTGGTGPYSCAPSGSPGILPLGVTLNTDCTLTGTPLNQGNFSFRVDVTDSSVGPTGPNPFTKLGTDTLSLVVAPPATPTVTAISPSSGPTAGGTAVTITGTDFTSATKVSFGSTDVLAANFTSISDTQIVVNSPAGSAGTVNVSVTTAGGTSADNGTADDFTYALPPASTAAFSVNSIPADNSTRTVVTVVVTNPNTTAVLTNLRATLSMPAGLTYVAGTASINPGSASGVSGTVSGSFFSVLIGSLPPGVSVTLRFEARSSIVGSYSVTTNPVTSSAGPGAGATTPTQLTVTEVAPSITALSPNSGATAGSTQVQITGNRFLTATGVTFGGVPAASFTILSQTQITAVSPPGSAGTVRVAVTNSAATTPDTAADDFTYLAPPTVAAVSPASGPTAGGTPVTITGTNFTGATKVSFGSMDVLAANFTSISGTQIVVNSPAGSAGTVNVSVTTVGGTSADAGTADDFSYGVPPTATLEFLQTSIPADGTTRATVRLTLTNPNPFTVSSTSFLYTLPTELTAVDGRNVNSCGSLIVNAGGVSASDSMSANRVCQYEVDVVSSSPGSYSLSTSNLSNPFGDGVQATTPVALTVAARPVVTSVSPAFDNIAGGKSITITGTNLTGATAVSFGGTAATGFTVNPAGTQITVNAPATASAGTVNVTVTTSGGTSADAGAADDFEYGTAPQVGAASFPTAQLGYTVPNPLQLPASITAQYFTGTVDGFYVGAGTDTSVTVSGITMSVDAAKNFNFQRPAGFRGGPVQFDFRAYNKFGVSQTRTFGVTVNNPIVSSSLSGSGAQQGVALSGYSIATNGGQGPYTCATTPATGSLPAGVSINADCTITGTPTQNGTFDFTLDVTDSSVGPGAGAASAPNPFTQRSGTLSLAVAAPVPTVTAVSPAFDNIAGGKAITISGTDFTGATKVTFGTTDVPAAGFTSISATQIVVNAPATASAGTVNVTVTTSGGTSADAGPADDFEYGTAPQTVFGINPDFGRPYNAANPLALPRDFILGAFSGTVEGIYIGSGTDTSATVSGVTLSVDAGLNFTTQRPAGFRGGPVLFDIRAYNKFGALTRTLSFQVNNPTLVSLLSGSGAQQGVALSGYSIATNGGQGPYTCATTPATGSLPAGVSINADCTITGTPTQSGTFDFTLDVTDSSVGPGAGAASAPNPFTQRSGTLSLAVAPALAPTITAAFSPATIPADGATEAELQLTINNPNAIGLTGVSIGSAALPANLLGTGAGATSTCGGTAAYNGPGATFAFSGGSIPANGSCTVKLPVYTTVADVYTYTTGAVSSTQSGAGSTASTATGLTAVATPASVTVISGSNQTATISTAFAAPLVAVVRDFASNPIQGVTVNFAAPNAGASAVLGSSSAVTGADGRASVTATANATAGGFNVTATVTGVATPATFAFFNSKANQTISFTPPAAQTFLPGGTIGLTATGGASGNPVTFASNSTAVCTTGGPNGVTVTFVAAGNCSITASQAGNDNYEAATPITDTFAIGKADQVIAFTPPAAQTFAPGGTVALTATGGASGNPVTFASNSTAVCTTGGTNGATVTFVSAGTCSITASQAGNDNYEAAKPVTDSFAIGKADQVIAFAPPAAQTFAPGGTVALTATGGASGNPVTFASNSAAVCSVAGSTVTFVAAGNCSITASQAGNDNYNDATPVTDTFAIGKASQTIAFTPPPAQTFAPGGTVALTATGGASGNPVTFASNSTAVCTTGGTNGATVTFVGAGNCSITASQAGNDNYEAATPVTDTFAIGKADQVIAFTPPAAQTFAPGGTVALSATGGASGNPVTFASNSATVCTVAGSTVTFVGAGNCSITASQAGNDNYEAATPITDTFAIGKAAQAISFTPPATQTFATGATVTLTATGGGSGNPVTFASNSAAICTTGGTNGATVTFVSVGSCSITASQDGNDNYVAAAPVTDSFTIDAPALVATQAVPSTNLTAGVAATSFAPVTGAGGFGTLSYALRNAAGTAPASLPAGLSFDASTGQISGTATVLLSTTTFTVLVTDQTPPAPQTASKTFSLTVGAPALTSVRAVPATTLTAGSAAKPFKPVTATGGFGTLTYALRNAAGTGAATLPAGLTFDTSTGQISGTPNTVLAATTYTVRVTDQATPTKSVTAKTFRLTVRAITTKIVLSASPSSVLKGQTMTLTAKISPSDAPGRIAFLDGGAALCANASLANGVATCVTSFASGGERELTASYAGNAVYAASTSAALRVTVTDQTAKTVETIASFMKRRNELILSNSFDEGRGIDRLEQANGAGEQGSGGGAGNFALGAPSSSGSASVSTGPMSRLGAADVADRFFGSGRRSGPALANEISSVNQPAVEDGPEGGRSFSPVTGGGDGDDNNLRFDFATSLSMIRKNEAAKEQARLQALGVSGDGVTGAGRSAFSPFDIWVEGKYASFESDAETSSAEGHFGLLTVGTDYVVSRSLLVGIYVQYDSMNERDDAKVTDVESRGWMAGPYFTMRLSENLYWQGRAAWGASTVDISPFQTYSDSFDTERWMVSSKLTGRWRYGDWTFSPAASLSYIEDTSDAYRDTFGALIPSVESSLGQAKIGPEVGYRYTMASGIIIEPRGKLELIWNFADDVRAPGLDVLLGDGAEFGEVRGRAELGVRAGTADGIAVDLSGAYDGIASDDAQAVSGKATLRIPLN